MPDYHNAIMISYDTVVLTTLKMNEHTFVVNV